MANETKEQLLAKVAELEAKENNESAEVAPVEKVEVVFHRGDEIVTETLDIKPVTSVTTPEFLAGAGGLYEGIKKIEERREELNARMMGAWLFADATLRNPVNDLLSSVTDVEDVRFATFPNLELVTKLIGDNEALLNEYGLDFSAEMELIANIAEAKEK